LEITLLKITLRLPRNFAETSFGKPGLSKLFLIEVNASAGARPGLLFIEHILSFSKLMRLLAGLKSSASGTARGTRADCA
jgi:hypothetical protein